MGKGNAILGYASGAVGSFVFARVKGQQVIKARNTKPHNRKSRAQILHRARLSTLYKFTKQLPPGLLDGAFSDCKPRENWQSCFVRHNISRAIMQPKAWVEDDYKPSYGKFMMSDGPIASDIVSTSAVLSSTYIGAVGVAVRPIAGSVTVAKFSQGVINLYGLNDGDILTFVIYDCGPAVSIRDPKYSSAYRTPQVLTESLRLDLSDSRAVSDVVRFVSVFLYAGDDAVARTWVGVRCDVIHQPAMAVIASRVEGNSVACNTSFLAWPGANQAFWDQFESEEWIRDVLRSWGVSRTALLKGFE